ncbi:RidA family protein [Halostagnicola sp. A-GB9-2]|uniref:RidA family protein n=1 Tax=Halostagnicola sp. A-GB9-2 TaxID=3048066 RepID=UPI0024BFEBE9|nr:RidA family protein [Halostagnicola sp. A-GB9-2]MDJ1433157.1 RidA family protein [Halostagnicola sp. A-GB9-2]
MIQPITDRSSQIERLSSTSVRQREKSTHFGALGNRTGNSDLVFLEGVLPGTDASTLNDLSIEEQTSNCFEKLEAVLAARGLELSDVLKLTVHLTDPANRDAVDDVYSDRFDGEYPPRTTIGVCSLPADASVQFDVIAAEE